MTHPATWGRHKQELLGQALERIGRRVTFLAEPQAAALSYASAERVAPGSTIAVYDLGGGTFDAAVVRKNGTFSLLGDPEGIERLGGLDFDDLIFSDNPAEGRRGALGRARPGRSGRRSTRSPSYAGSASRRRSRCPPTSR